MFYISKSNLLYNEIVFSLVFLYLTAIEGITKGTDNVRVVVTCFREKKGVRIVMNNGEQ